ncbi:TPA: molecular chaperone [Citrobacter freundii]
MRRILLFMLWGAASWACQAGIIASSTRVIFREDETQKSLMLVNTNSWPVVVQTWVDDGGAHPVPGKVKTPFVAIPPVFQLSAKGMQGLRLIHNKMALPADRESAFWLNIYEIPPTKASVATQQQNMVLTINTQMKIFWRPAKLNNPESARKQITFRRDGAGLICHNASPYHVSFADISVDEGGKTYSVDPLPDMMVPPFSEKRYSLSSAAPLYLTSVQARIIGDEGKAVGYTYPVH